MSASIADVVELFLGEMERAHTLGSRTLAKYRCELHPAAGLLTVPLDQLDAPALDRFLTRGMVAPGTVVRRQATLRRFFV